MLGMNTAQFEKKLMNCRTYADAQPILEAMNLGPAAHTLARTAFGLPATQETYKRNFLADIVSEARMKEEEEKKEEEEGGKKLKMEEEEEEEDEDDDKKMHEYEGGDSHRSSKPGMEHLERKDKQTGNGAVPDTGFEGAQNQMKEALVAAGIPESVALKVVKEMDKSAPSTKLMMETINATVKRMVSPLITEIKKQREAIIAQNKKIIELSTKASSSVALDFHSGPQVGRGSVTRETETMNLGDMNIKRRPSLEDRRNAIRELDNAMNNGLISKNLPDAYQ